MTKTVIVKFKIDASNIVIPDFTESPSALEECGYSDEEIKKRFTEEEILDDEPIEYPVPKNLQQKLINTFELEYARLIPSMIKTILDNMYEFEGLELEIEAANERALSSIYACSEGVTDYFGFDDVRIKFKTLKIR